MVSYNVVTSPKALSQLEEYIDYIRHTLFNKQAAASVWSDALETVGKPENVAGSLSYCDDPDLKELGYRKISFIHHRYVMIYRVENNTAYVEAIYHQLQDYENIFADSLTEQ